MSLSFNGAPVSETDYTRSWGVTPASATIVCPGEVGAAVDDEVAMAYGAETFFGRVTSIVEDRTNGLFTRIGLADNRLLLHREYVACAFNQVEVIEDDITTPGIDRKKRYWHILPDDWALNNKTYTTAPLTAAEILDYLHDAPTLVFEWIFDTHEAQEKPVFGIDALNGAKLGNVLSELSEKQGLVFTLTGENTLTWVRKGEGTVPTLPANAFDRSDGTAMSNNDTRIRVIGDRNRYQIDSVTLLPDWNAHFEAYWLEAAWLERVDALFGPFDATVAGQAALFAAAKSGTMRQYVAATSADNADYGKWGEISRMELPVWIYLQDVVFKAYRVPRSITLGDSDWNALELCEGLLQEMDYSPSTGALTVKEDGEPYPDTKALIIAQGQQMGVIDPKYQKALTPDQIASARTLFSVVPRFALDTKNKVVIFEEAVVVPGAGAAGLFVFPNVGVDETDLAETHPEYFRAVPNAAVTITPAVVRATLVFEAERFFSDYGSGYQRGTHYVRGLRRDALMVAGVFSAELEYADAKTAVEKADEVVDGLLVREATYRHGGFKRRGTVGTALNGVIDRVTIRVNAAVGIEEEVEFTKERSPNAYNHEREMDRKQRQKEVFPGQEKNREEVWALHELAKLGKELKRPAPPAHRAPNDVVSAPVGVAHSSPTIIADPDVALGTVSGGQVIVISPDTGRPVFEGTGAFAGVAVGDGATGYITVATQGTVAVRVKGPVVAGDAVGWVSGQTYCQTSGAIPVGTMAASYAGSEVVVLPVRLGAGAQASARPLQTSNASVGATPKIKLSDGQVYSNGSLTPTIAGAPISDAEPPALTVAEDDIIIYLKLTLDDAGQYATAVSVHSSASALPPANDDDFVYVKIATIVVTIADEIASVDCESVNSGSIVHLPARDFFTDPPEFSHGFGFL